jgi:hypothetical protein
MTDITQIPLNELVASEDTVRRTAPTDAGLQELAASIAAHGLLQSLVVRKHRKATYAVVAGRRLLAAMQLLAEQGSIDASFAVPCQCRMATTRRNSALSKPPCANRCIPPTSSRPSAIISTTERPLRISPPVSALHAPRGRTASQAGPRQPPLSSALFVPVN